MTTSSSTSVKPSSARRRERSISPGSSTGGGRALDAVRRRDGPRGRGPARRAWRRSGRCRRTRGSAPDAARRRGRRSARRCRGRPYRCWDRARWGRSRADRLEARRRDRPLGALRGRADRRIRGLVGGQRSAHRGRHLAVGQRAAAGRRRGTRSRRWRAPGQRNRTPGTAGTPSGERAASASNASGFIAGLRSLGPSGLVNSSAPVGASSSSPSSVSAEPPMFVHSQPSMPCSRGTTAVADSRLQDGEAARLLRGPCAGPRSTMREVQLAERELQRLPQEPVDLERCAVRAQPEGVGRHAAAGLERDRDRVRPAPPAGGGGAEDIAVDRSQPSAQDERARGRRSSSRPGSASAPPRSRARISAGVLRRLPRAWSCEALLAEAVLRRRACRSRRRCRAGRCRRAAARSSAPRRSGRARRRAGCRPGRASGDVCRRACSSGGGWPAAATVSLVAVDQRADERDRREPRLLDQDLVDQPQDRARARVEAGGGAHRVADERGQRGGLDAPCR